MKRTLRYLDTFLEGVILALVIILLIFSFVVVALLCVESTKYNLDISIDATHRLIDLVGEFKVVFAATIGIITLHLVLRRVEIATTANRIAARNDWTKKLNERIGREVGASNRSLVRYFEIHADDIYDYLSETDMKISDKKALEKFFQTHVAAGVISFEMGTSAYEKHNGVYQFSISSYSYQDHFTKIKDYIFKPTSKYQSITEDIRILYLAEIEIDPVTKKLKA